MTAAIMDGVSEREAASGRSVPSDPTVPSGPTEVDAAIASVEEQFTALYRQVKTKMRQRASLVHPDLAVMGYVILTTLKRCGATHAGALIETLGMDKSLLSRQLRALEELGLVERELDPTDKRSSILTQTELGRERVNTVQAADRAALHGQLRDWEVGDLNRLAELLSRVNEFDR
jgi:DNA-binding MarR family transcriptional regulator